MIGLMSEVETRTVLAMEKIKNKENLSLAGIESN
jgi:hypothetical protein